MCCQKPAATVLAFERMVPTWCPRGAHMVPTWGLRAGVGPWLQHMQVKSWNAYTLSVLAPEKEPWPPYSPMIHLLDLIHVK